MSIPPMGRIIPPPPKVNKNKLWQKYAAGEILKPTYNVINSKIPPPPPKPQEPRSITEGKLGISKRPIYSLIFFIGCCIVGWLLGKLIGMAAIFILQFFEI